MVGHHQHYGQQSSTHIVNNRQKHGQHWLKPAYFNVGDLIMISHLADQSF
jgi:hypothetical protein